MSSGEMLRKRANSVGVWLEALSVRSASVYAIFLILVKRFYNAKATPRRRLVNDKEKEKKKKKER